MTTPRVAPARLPGVEDGMVVELFHGPEGPPHPWWPPWPCWSADGGEGGGGDDGRHGEPPPVAAEPPVGGVVEIVVVSRVEDDLADKDEHGDDGETVAGKEVPDLRSDHSQRRAKGREEGESRESDHGHDKGGWDPQKEEAGKHGEDAEDPGQGSAHPRSSALRSARRNGMILRRWAAVLANIRSAPASSPNPWAKQVRARAANPRATAKTKGW